MKKSAIRASIMTPVEEAAWRLGYWREFETGTLTPRQRLAIIRVAAAIQMARSNKR